MRFLTSGRPRPGTGKTPKNLLAMASWKPYPLPGGAVIPVGFRCRRVWLLLQSYVHPMKNYIPNGEVVLHYAGGRQTVESLVPPYNLDCYFQHFSQKGLPVALGRFGPLARRLDADLPGHVVCPRRRAGDSLRSVQRAGIGRVARHVQRRRFGPGRHDGRGVP